MIIHRDNKTYSYVFEAAGHTSNYDTRVTSLFAPICHNYEYIN